MSGRTRSIAILAAVVAVLVVVAAGPVSAHPRPATPALPDLVVVPEAESLAPVTPAPAPVEVPAADPSSPAAGVLVLAAALSAAVVLRRRGLVAGLALLVGVLAVEANVHAVHHLNDAQAAAQCVVAVVSAQVNGTLEQPPSVDDALAGAPVDSVLAPSPERPGSRSRRPDEGRAPPTA